MISPTGEDDEAWLARMWQEAREHANRTFSNVAVTQAGVRLLEVTPQTDPDKSLVAIRDTAGHTLLQNDTGSGWGLAAPLNGYSSYPAWPFTSTASTVAAELWLFGGYTYTNSIEWAYIHGTEFPTTFSECQLEYSTDLVGWTLMTGTVTQSNEDVSDETTVFTLRSGTFDLPIVASGNFFGIRLMCRKASGPGLKAFCSPVYLNPI